MTKQQIEAWALRVIAQVKQKHQNEDAFVELKTEWIDAQKAARRIAGHANSAHGEDILWLIGVDETSGPVSLPTNDMANWLSQVCSHFNELPPEIIDLNIPVDGTTIVALLIQTDRAPFVVKNASYGQQGGGPVELEVPWREGTRVRTATRANLISMLTPTLKLP